MLKPMLLKGGNPKLAIGLFGLALFVEFAEELFEFWLLFWRHEGAKLFAALLADLFFLSINGSIQRFPLGARVVNNYRDLFLLFLGEVHFVGELGNNGVARPWRGLMAPDLFAPQMCSEGAE